MKNGAPTAARGIKRLNASTRNNQLGQSSSIQANFLQRILLKLKLFITKIKLSQHINLSMFLLFNWVF